MFDQISYHATAHRWIALAYTYKSLPMSNNKNGPHYNIGVDLYDYRKEVQIIGTGSLKESLKKLYGDGGYLLKFRKEDFMHMKGLGNLEVVSLKVLRPVSIERIHDPVAEMLSAGVEFRFISSLCE